MMIRTLAENTSLREELRSEHGLSLYIEAAGHRILFDTGGSGLFAENAEKLGVDLGRVDLVVLSHGHYDHGGGLKFFLELNRDAKVYAHERAFEEHWGNRQNGVKAYIGLDKELLRSGRFILTGERLDIGEDLTLFAGVTGSRFFPSGNADLFMGEKDAPVPDDFGHEQNLIIREGGRAVLIAGCAHRGIVNIISRFRELEGRWPDAVISGFHLHNPAKNLDEAPEMVDAVARALLETGASCYTCHCTGLGPYRRLRAAMGEKIGYLSTGEQLVL